MVKVKLKRESLELNLARKNLSQNWLAKQVGISSGYMSQLLRGERCPSPEIRCKILQQFKDKKFDDFFVLNGWKGKNL